MKKTTLFFEYAGMALGSALMAFALHFFLEPNTIAPGGVTGLAVVIQRITAVPMDVTNLLINIPLFIAGILILGKAFGAKTAYATLMLSVFLRLFIIVFGTEGTLTSDILLAAVYGGVSMGVGLGLIFRLGGTTGGTDLAGAILNKFFPSLSIAKLMMILDLIIVGIAGLVEIYEKFFQFTKSAFPSYVTVRLLNGLSKTGLLIISLFFTITPKGESGCVK